MLPHSSSETWCYSEAVRFCRTALDSFDIAWVKTDDPLRHYIDILKRLTDISGVEHNSGSESPNYLRVKQWGEDEQLSFSKCVWETYFLLTTYWAEGSGE